MAGTFADRMAEQEGWVTFASEEFYEPFGDALDDAIAAGQISRQQAMQLEDIAVSQGEDAAFDALDNAIGAARGGQALLPAPAGFMPLAAPGGGAVAGPAAAAAARPRGKIGTMVVRQVPGMAPQVVSVRQGGVALYAQDLAAVKRVKRVEKKLRSIFPRRPRKRAIFKPAGKAIA